MPKITVSAAGDALPAARHPQHQTPAFRSEASGIGGNTRKPTMNMAIKVASLASATPVTPKITTKGNDKPDPVSGAIENHRRAWRLLGDILTRKCAFEEKYRERHGRLPKEHEGGKKYAAYLVAENDAHDEVTRATSKLADTAPTTIDGAVEAVRYMVEFHKKSGDQLLWGEEILAFYASLASGLDLMAAKADVTGARRAGATRDTETKAAWGEMAELIDIHYQLDVMSSKDVTADALMRRVEDRIEAIKRAAEWQKPRNLSEAVFLIALASSETDLIANGANEYARHAAERRLQRSLYNVVRYLCEQGADPMNSVTGYFMGDQCDPNHIPLLTAEPTRV